jgi:hypothetical protein
MQKKVNSCALSLSTGSSFGTPTSAETELDRSLSFRSNASSNASSTYTVKNTFIHVDEGSDLEPLPELKRSASEPIFFKSQPCQRNLRKLKTTMGFMESDSSAQSNGSEPQVSIGSVAHESGNCRPCAWFWKAKGCENGSQCRHCHLCPENEIKRRRYKKLAEKKMQKHNARSQKEDEGQDVLSTSDAAAL